jgi:hypothetical protein
VTVPINFALLAAFAADCRSALEGMPANRRHVTCTSFPIAACGTVSEALGRLLEERFGVTGEYVCGVSHPHLPENQSHAWVETGGWIIDVTHDQFPNTDLDGWVFPSASLWHASFDDVERRPGFCMPAGWPEYPHAEYGAMRAAVQKHPSRAER